MAEISRNNRLKYIDALRGITMLLVVYYHVEVFSFGERDSLINSLFISFRMPLFFFISGFIAYKGVVWDGDYFFKMLKKKFLVQIIPTMFFCVLYYCVCQSENFLIFMEKGPRFYWFTITLFYMFLVYYIIMFLTRKCVKVRVLALCTMSIIGLVVYAGIWLELFSVEKYTFLFIGYLAYYFEFFVFGLLCKKYYSKFEHVISSNNVKAVLILLFTLSYIVLWNETFIEYNLFHKFNSSFLLRYLGLLTVFSIIYNYRNTFDSDNRIVKGLRFIGRRTLDIYLLHYFFLPELKGFMDSCSFMFEPENTLIELVVVLSISLIVVAFCLGISAIIRSSSVLGHYLFGAKL